jgi:hypothetical protein
MNELIFAGRSRTPRKRETIQPEAATNIAVIEGRDFLAIEALSSFCVINSHW